MPPHLPSPALALRRSQDHSRQPRQKVRRNTGRSCSEEARDEELAENSNTSSVQSAQPTPSVTVLQDRRSDLCVRSTRCSYLPQNFANFVSCLFSILRLCVDLHLVVRFQIRKHTR